MNDSLERIKDTLTSVYWNWSYLNQEDCPPDLLTALREKLTHIPSKSWKKRMHFGGVFVNGRLSQANKELIAPCRVEYYEPKFDIDNAAELFPPFSKENVVFQDEHLLVYYKPHGIPTIPNREQRSYNVKVYVEEYLGKQIHLPSRLDTSTEGLVIVSCSSEMHARLQRLFERRLIEKTYLLEVAQEIDWETQTIDAPIGYNPKHRVLRMVDHENGSPAVTHFRRIGEGRGIETPEGTLKTTILEAKPKTGRTHQIRVHAQECAGPIIGDSFYEGANDTNLHLMSYQLAFTHPITEQQIIITAPTKLQAAWSLPALETDLL